MAANVEFTVKPTVTEQMLQKITQCIVETFHPLKIILFGSYAYGNPTPDSDIDLLVVIEGDGRPAQRSAKVAQACRPRYIAMDVLVQSPVEIEQRLTGFEPFLEKILTKGRILYAASG